MSFVSDYAPGHVELLGNHLDYDEGYVLSAAIDRGIHIEATLHNDDKIVFEFVGGATVSLVSRKAANSAAIEFAARYMERTGLVCETYVYEIAEGAH